ncbi:MAG: CHRD domain-containing protein [Methylococcaceae bacterium]
MKRKLMLRAAALDCLKMKCERTACLQRKITLMPRLFAALILVQVAVAPAAWADETFKATLSGDEEVPPVVTDTTGKFDLQLNKAETEAEFSLRVNDGVRIRQAHLHCAPIGVNGPIVAFLAGDNAAGYDVDGKWISNATLTDTSISNPACGATISALAASMRAGNVYVNVHSVANPSGAIRGQVEAAGDD